MTKQKIFAPNSNIDFIQLKLFDFSDEKIDQEKIISERLNKVPNFENTNQKLFLDENDTFKGTVKNLTGFPYFLCVFQ